MYISFRNNTCTVGHHCPLGYMKKELGGWSKNKFGCKFTKKETVGETVF